jgi:putative ABC transport system substrate-binding protein
MKKAAVQSILIAGVLLAVGVIAAAQQPTKVPRIGYVGGTDDPRTPGPFVNALRQGLHDLGYVEGKNILFEYRSGEGKRGRYPSLVTELVQLKVDVLVSPTPAVIRAAMQATKTIPIVMVTPVDPVAAGLINSLARPGGNVTGVTRLTQELSGKRLELLKELVPGISRVGILWAEGTSLRDHEAAARALKIQLQLLEVRRPDPDYEGAFQSAAKRRVSAIISVTGPLATSFRKRIADLAIKNRLPSMYESSFLIGAGGLVSYAANDAESFRRAAVFVDKILKGTKPADLPVEQPTKFEFIINLKTAKQIGLTIPPTVLARADKVIK